MADIVQLIENGQKKFLKTHVQAIDGLQGELAKYELKSTLKEGIMAWEGGLMMSELNTVTPSVPLDQCKSGWILVWYKYENSVLSSYPTRTFIPKSGGGGYAPNTIAFPIGLMQVYNSGATIVKIVKWTNTTITGHGANNLEPNNRSILKEVIAI